MPSRGNSSLLNRPPVPRPIRIFPTESGRSITTATTSRRTRPFLRTSIPSIPMSRPMPMPSARKRRTAKLPSPTSRTTSIAFPTVPSSTTRIRTRRKLRWLALPVRPLRTSRPVSFRTPRRRPSTALSSTLNSRPGSRPSPTSTTPSGRSAVTPSSMIRMPRILSPSAAVRVHDSRTSRTQPLRLRLPMP